MILEPRERLIVALDVASKDEVAAVCRTIGEEAVFYKVGLQLFLVEGREVVELIKGLGKKVFLDLKLHDIPNQVVGACREIAKMDVNMTTIHTMGGFDMMQEAAKTIKETAQEIGTQPPILLGVTVLTSLNQERAGQVGISKSITEQVVDLALLAKKSGLDGVVASPQEVKNIRQAVGDNFIIVTPGIRSAGDAVQDQKRVMSARDAILAGSSYLVVGRPVLKAQDPAAAAMRIVSEISEAGISA